MSRRKDHDNYCYLCNSQIRGQITEKVVNGKSVPICRKCFYLLKILPK